MILCLIIVIAAVITAIIGGIRAYRQRWEYDELLGPILLVCGVLVALIVGIGCLCSTIEASQELNAFISQKEYIENYQPTSEYDTAAIIHKKIELNQWLFEEQYVREHRPICSFYGDEILELEPIK